MAGLSLVCPPGPEDGHCPLRLFWKRAAMCPAQHAGTALSPSGNAGSSRPFSSHPQALTGGGKFGGQVS